MADLIIFASIVFVALFFVAWVVRPDLRAWIEKPKYRFQANVQDFDLAQYDQAKFDQAQYNQAQKATEVSGGKERA